MKENVQRFGRFLSGMVMPNIGAIVSMGVIVASESPMFLGTMVAGPASAWVIKKFDQKMEGHIPAGFEIVVTHRELGERAAHSNPNAERILITNFLAAPEYEALVEDLKERNR